MNRRSFIAMSGVAGLAGHLPGAGVAATGELHPVAAAWTAWKEAHLDASGRVIDRLQDLVSHSEGQSYALLMAETLGDIETFETVLEWTDENLAVRPDALLAWRWEPDAVNPVTDPNNASDADIFFAWALLRASIRFDRPLWRERARAVVADLEASCIVDFPGHAGAYLLLPGAIGFATETGYVINPSYYMFRAMDELARTFDARRLGTASSNGDVLMAELARNGPIPDWIEVSEAGLARSERFSVNSGYEAMRVPLWLLWSGKIDHPAIAAGLSAEGLSALPGDIAATVVEYETGAVLETSTAPGYRAIAALAFCAADQDAGSTMPPFDPEQTYYPASLHVFSFLAQIDKVPQCFPL